jgi:uncharacterized membrane protein YcaP (DUF421 family)
VSGFESPDWGEMFVPARALAESFLRGSVVYLSLIILFRVILKRQTGSLGLPDVLLVVLVSECVSQALTANANSITNGLVTVAALLFWDYALDCLAHRWPWFQRRLEPAPLPLVKDGKIVRENLDKEGITEEELEAQLRLNGVDDPAQVKLAIMESEGTVSVVERDSGSGSSTPDTTSGGDPAELDRLAREFLAAAAALQKAATGCKGRSKRHQAAAKAARQLLTRHGVSARRALKSPPHADPKE